jgi:DNA polymerase-1
MPLGPKRKTTRSICNRRSVSQQDWRSLIKLQNTYVEALPLQVDADKAHSYRLYADRGSNGPIEFDKMNLQNIPIRTEQKIRKAFIAA